MTKKLLQAVVVLACVLTCGRAIAWSDISVDIVSLLTSEELVQDTAVTLGVDTSGARVASGDATATINISGNYHSEHGLTSFSSTVSVEGAVKIGIGTCAWGGAVSVKDADGNEVASFTSNTGVCWHNDKTGNIAYGYYKSTTPTTLTISGGSYVPYVSVEAVDAASLVEDATVTYAIGEGSGVVPAAETVEVGQSVTIPTNLTIYKDGHTLTGWTDGTTTYAIGQTMTVSADTELVPVFTANSVSLDDRTEAVTVKWDFSRAAGAPTVGWQGNTGAWVAQATIAGETIDVVLAIDATSGKFSNSGRSDAWMQVNDGTLFTIPSCKGATMSFYSYGTASSSTVDGEAVTASGNTATFTSATNDDMTLTVGGASYMQWLQVVLPVVASSASTSYDNYEASVIWPFNSATTYDSEVAATPDEAFSMTSFDLGSASVTGTATRTAEPLLDGVTFVKIKPSSAATDAVTWQLKTAKGLTFTPTKVTMYIQRFGTDAQNGVTITAKAGDGTAVTLGNYTAPRANHDTSTDKYASNSNYTSLVEIDLTAEQQAALTTDEILALSATIGVGNTKEGGFSDVRIYGLLNGSAENVAKYTLTTQASPEGAATITTYPASDEYEAGTEVKITATKNFGYKFVNWTDAAGKEIGTTNVITVTMDSDMDLTANYEAVNTYELRLGVAGGANSYMVTAEPTGTNVDGKLMYEDGQAVIMTAASNEILTFTNWSDGETNATKTVTMTADIELTAAYSAIDYLAGWDFYLAGNSSRAADFYSEDNDAAVLVMRTEDGTLASWLDKSEVNAGGYEGRAAAVNWTTTGLGNYYWQTCVNAANFTDLKIITATCYNYNAYTTQLIDYSLDNENWENIGSITMSGNKNWTDGTFSLPATADNQEKVYIRIKSDTSSDIAGTSSSNDGIALGATWIIGNEALVDDGTAPALISQVPAEGADNASANGKIVLTFDEKIVLVEGATATVGTQTINPAVSGMSLICEYKGLEYSSDYTFTLPANSVSDRTGNLYAQDIVINFTTKTRPAIDKALYDFIVPTDGNFREAINAANNRADKSTRYRIFVLAGAHISPTEGEAAGTNDHADTMYPDPRVVLTASNTSIIGEGLELSSVTNVCPEAASGTTNPIEGLQHAYVLKNSGTNTYVQDIKFINGMEDATGRGEAWEESGDKTIMKEVGLWGYQDTYCSNNGKARYYFEGGVIRGRTDYICGKDDIFFNGVEFRNVGTGGYIAVPSSPKQYGWILRDCRITAESSDNNGKYYLGRPWGSGTPIALWINTVCESTPAAIGWAEMSSGWPNRFAEFGSVTASGTTIDLSGRKTTFGDGHANDPILTAEEAAFYTIANVLGGDDDWDPTEATEQASAPADVVISDEGVLTWSNSQYVLCWAVCKNGNVVDFTTDPKYTVTDTDATWSIRAANEMGGLGEATVAVYSETTGISSIAASEIVSSAYYNMQGMQVAPSAKGVLIRVDSLANGTTQTVKIVK